MQSREGSDLLATRQCTLMFSIAFSFLPERNANAGIGAQASSDPSRESRSAGVKLRSFTVPVFEAALDEFAGLGVCHCDLPKTEMTITVLVRSHCQAYSVR
jgi:hypothetical protein